MRRRASEFKARRSTTPKPGKGSAVYADHRRRRHNYNVKPAELACQKKAFSQVSSNKAYSFTVNSAGQNPINDKCSTRAAHVTGDLEWFHSWISYWRADGGQETCEE
jgi:hypothetical protein